MDPNPWGFVTFNWICWNIYRPRFAMKYKEHKMDDKYGQIQVTLENLFFNLMMHMVFFMPWGESKKFEPKDQDNVMEMEMLVLKFIWNCGFMLTHRCINVRKQTIQKLIWQTLIIV